MLAFFTLGLLLCNGQESYKLKTVVDTSTFLNYFWFDTNDYNHGEVQYVTASEAQSRGMLRLQNNQIYMGADMSTYGRPKSIKVISHEKYTTGLFIIQLQHMPAGCGTWPAFWFTGPNWPNSGEIDVIEQVNAATHDATTLHTSSGCTASNNGEFTGTLNNANCYVHGNDNTGCGITDNDGASFGSAFNSAGGGAFAMLWDSGGISAWSFRAGRIPADILNRQPMPATWGKPYAKFNFGSMCSANHFQNNEMVINCNFCGDWAGNTFYNDCPGKGSCQQWVDNPSNRREAYWLINEITIYSVSGGPTPDPHQSCCCDQSNTCINDDWCNMSQQNCEGPCNANHDHHWGPPGGSSACCLYQGQCIDDDWCNQSEQNCLGPCNDKHDKRWGPPNARHGYTRRFRNATVGNKTVAW